MSGTRTVLVLASLIGALLIGGCAPSPSVVSPTPTSTLTPAVRSTDTPAPGPTPVSGLLDPPPQTCPSSPSPQSISFQHFGGFVGSVTFEGASPVWIPSPYYPAPVLHLNRSGYTPYPVTKIIWEVGPSYAQPVTVRITNLQTGELTWWGHGGPPQGHEVQTLILDQAASTGADSHGSPENGWWEWGSALYISVAGCYELDATWASGRWRVVFAAGQ